MTKKFTDWSKEKLIEHINSLYEELENTYEHKNKEFMVNFPWAGNLGQWNMFYDTNRVISNDKKTTQLGYDPREIGDVGHEFFTDKLHEEDYDRVMKNMRDHLAGKTDVYEVEYRIQHKNGHYIWYYDRGSVIKRDKQGNPLIVQGIVFDITEWKKIEAKLRTLSETDDLTNAYNRRQFFQNINVLKDEQNAENAFSLIMFDIDKFKEVNDTYGHIVGDHVLQELSKLIKDNLRDTDEFYRYGGEEFFIVLDKTTLQQAVQIAERFQSLIKNNSFEEVGSVTVSMGVVENKNKESVDELITRADELVYEAKKNGRDQIKSN